MTQLHSGRPELDYFLVVAHQERAEAMARVAYLLVDAVGRAGHAVIGGLARGLRPLSEAISRWQGRRSAVRALQKLDDRMLQDIGLTRADVWAMERGAVPAANGEEVRGQKVTAVIDVALSDRAIRGCNDNGSQQRAA